MSSPSRVEDGSAQDMRLSAVDDDADSEVLVKVREGGSRYRTQSWSPSPDEHTLSHLACKSQLVAVLISNALSVSFTAPPMPNADTDGLSLPYLVRSSSLNEADCGAVAGIIPSLGNTSC